MLKNQNKIFDLGEFSTSSSLFFLHLIVPVVYLNLNWMLSVIKTKTRPLILSNTSVVLQFHPLPPFCFRKDKRWNSIILFPSFYNCLTVSNKLKNSFFYCLYFTFIFLFLETTKSLT